MRHTLLAFVLLMSACGDNGSETSPFTTTPSTGGTSDGSSTAPINCAEKNAVVHYPERCTGWGKCDNTDFAEATCLEQRHGEYVVRCTEEGQGISGLCPYGCDRDSDPVGCLAPTEKCGDDGLCGDTPGCKFCRCGLFEGTGCFEDFLVTSLGAAQTGPPYCEITTLCPFGCEVVSGEGRCCTDGNCKWGMTPE